VDPTLLVRDSTAAVTLTAKSLWTLAQTGIIRPYRPDRLVRLARTLVRWGLGPAGGYVGLADRMPEAVGVVDELGSLTFGEIHRDTNAIARGLARLGVREGEAVAVMCRNHRWFVEATVGVAKLGADVLYLNTAFSGPQLVEVLQGERPRVVIYDAEFAALVAEAQGERVVAWHDDAEPADAPTLADLVAGNKRGDLPAPEREGRTVILTSGTTGTPKGASRGSGTLSAAAALVSRLPMRHGWGVHVAAPMFHTWGWAHLNLSMLIGSTLVLRRRFDPEGFLDAVSEQRCDAAVVIPVMLQRVLDLPESVRRRYDLSSLQVVAASGSELPGDLATRWMDAFGEHLYNVYGTTECAWATIASPDDMRSATGTAGRPPLGTRVELFDDRGRPVSDGVGRIFVGNPMLFEGYTAGGSKETIDDLMATGDVGRIEDGLLFVEGRDDDMIVSGGENVYPREVEDCLARHGDIADAAAIGVRDVEFGQRLRAFVVVREGAELTEDDVRDHVKAQLARYKVPRDVWFCAELPRNATGKIVKRELAAWESPSPDVG
jgi:acyl-CoA synthetase (AMP-forming)/AMP-acid ligase II